MLPLFGRLGVRIPWRYDPGNFVSWIIAILGLALYFGVRLRRELRDESESRGPWSPWRLKEP